VGPMRAAAKFAQSLKGRPVVGVRCEFYGSLAATGKGHGTDDAVILGLLGERPDRVDVDAIPALLEEVRESGALILPDGRSISFHEGRDLDFRHLAPLVKHPNGMRFRAMGDGEEILADETVYSVGGGFVVKDDEWDQMTAPAGKTVPYPFDSAKELLDSCLQSDLSISELMLANEAVYRSEEESRVQLDAIWSAMEACVVRGMTATGTLPGGLGVTRRAHELYRGLRAAEAKAETDPLTVLDWVNLFALAVNEENAAGGRVVTAPTNGAAGIIPAVLHYAVRFKESPYSDGVHRFLLAAGAIAMLYKKNASISGADVGCQGEVGVACSMAAGALVEYLGGSPEQVEFAAEIGMEHNLGLTCDPIGGLVQIPCIERNAMGSVKAINAARLAMSGKGTHFVSLDKVIKTMKDTGRDMMTKYKETSRGGLAVNVVEC
jgi:L-serine dehydratase